MAASVLLYTFVVLVSSPTVNVVSSAEFLVRSRVWFGSVVVGFDSITSASSGKRTSRFASQSRTS